MQVISRKQAKIEGKTQYFTGHPCKYGHIDTRFVAGGTCRSCNQQTKKTDKSKQSYRRYRKQHKDKVNKRSIAYYHSSLAPKIKKLRNENPEEGYKNQRNWEKRHPGRKRAITAARQIAILQATPKWYKYEKKAIADLYEQSSLLTKQTGKLYTVDHIVPIQGKKVCGLHTLCNLRIITGKENFSKNNKFDV